MAAPIEKEKKQRKKKLRSNIALVVGGGLFFYLWLHICTVINMDRRVGIVDGVLNGFTHAFTKPFEYKLHAINLGVGLFIVAIIVILVVFKRNDKEMRKHDNPDTVNGEAHLMTVEELEAYQMKYADPIGQKGIDGSNNMIISKEIRLAIDGRRTRRNCNILCIGGSGAGKSRFFAAPNILQYNANFVITDPSGELLEDYGKALENAGYEILVFNITDVYRSNRYNPFHYIREEKDVFILVNTLIKNTTPPDAHVGDPIWENGEKLILEAIILYLWHMCPEELQTFESVVKMINMAEVDENDATVQSPLDKLFTELEKEDPDNLAVEQYKTFKIAAGKTMKSFLISVGTRLQTFKLSDIKYLTATDDFHFERFSDTKKALFVVIPTADDTFNFIVSMLYTQLFSSLYSYVETNVKYGWQVKIGKRDIIHVDQAVDEETSKKAEEKAKKWLENAKNSKKPKFNKTKNYWVVYGADGSVVGWRGTKEEAEKFRASLAKAVVEPCKRRCPWHVRFILDEFANIGQLPTFNEKLATMRKYEISCAIILQALSQLKDLYKDSWNTIVANCDTKLFLGCDDSETIKWIIEMLGKKTTTVENVSYSSGGKGGGSMSYNKSSIEVMTIDQVTMMKEDECIVRIRGVRPYYGKKYELTEHPNYKAAMAVKGQFEIPISAEARERRDRNRGPLRLKRADSALLSAEAESKKIETETEQIKESTEKSVEQLKNENNERKKEAEEKKKAANDALKEMKSMPESPVLDDQLSKVLSKAFGASSKDTDDQIREAVESMIELERPESGNMMYGITG